MSDLLEKGRTQGYLLTDDLLALFPNAEEQIEHLDQLYTSLVTEGIEVLENAPAHPETDRRHAHEERIEQAEQPSGVGDSVRLYLQQIGETDLLTMQGEVDLSKRIELGKFAIASLAEDAELSLGGAEVAASARRRWRAGPSAPDSGEFALGGLCCKAVCRPRYVLSRSDPGRQHRPHEGHRQVRLQARIQIQHVCDLVDPPGNYALNLGTKAAPFGCRFTLAKRSIVFARRPTGCNRFMSESPPPTRSAGRWI